MVNWNEHEINNNDTCWNTLIRSQAELTSIITDYVGSTMNEKTLDAMAESRKIIEEGTARFSTAEELFEHLDKKLEQNATQMQQV